MVTKNSRASSVGAATPTDALSLLGELPRRQLALLSQSTAALYRASQAVRKVQQQAAERALAHQQEVTQRLLEPLNPSAFMQLHNELLRFHVQEGVQYWQELTAVAMKTQQDMVTGVAEGLDREEPSLDVLQRVFEASLDQTTAAAAAAH